MGRERGEAAFIPQGSPPSAWRDLSQGSPMRRIHPGACSWAGGPEVCESSHTSQPGGLTYEQDVGMHEGFRDKQLPQRLKAPPVPPPQAQA